MPRGSEIMKFEKQLLTPVAYLFAATLLSSCSQTQTISTPDGGKATFVAKSDGTTFTGTSADGGSMTMTSGSSAKYPADFPVVQYPNSKIQMTLGSQGLSGSGAAQNIVITTTDSIDKVIEFYKPWFGSNGWKIEMEFKGDGSAILAASKGETTAQVSAASAPKDGSSETTITISLQKK